MGDVIDVTAEDIAEMRRDGSFAEFLKHLSARKQSPAATAVPKSQAEREPGRRPGAWPTGTQPPTATPELPTEAWQQAVHDYRAWITAGCPEGDFTCECGCTPAARRRREAA